MQINTNDIYEFYKENDEDLRLKRTKVNNIEFLTTMKYIEQLCKPGSRILDACAGTGTYAFHLANMGFEVVAGDLVDSNVKKIIEQQEKEPLLEQIYTGSTMDLSMFEDGSFDVVLNLGSFYHIISEKDRRKSIQESLRVLKPSGIYFIAYLNRYANIIKYIDQTTEDFQMLEKYLEKGYESEDSLFYASSPEEIELMMSKFSIEQLHNIATDGLKFFIRDTVNELSNSDFGRWMDYHYKTCEVRSLLGYSEHGLYIGRKL